MLLISSLMFGVSASLDALLVGISLGLRRIRIRPWQNLLISLVTLFGTCLSSALGSRITPLLPDILGSLAGSLILMLLGAYYITKWTATCLQGKCHREITGQEIPSSGLPLGQVLLFSVTLSANNVGIGLSASMAGLPLLPSAAATFACSLLFLFSGNRLGQSRLFSLAGHLADPLAGTLLIALGILQLAW